MAHSIPKQARINKEKAEARKKIVESVRDLTTLKISLPIMDRSFKHVHTNQFLWTTLPKKFALANFDEITRGMGSADNRFGDYQTNKWYIESLTINNDGGKFTMDLDLNPFPSSIQSYNDAVRGYEKAYREAVNKQNNSSSKSTKKSNTVKSVKTDVINWDMVKKWSVPSSVYNVIKKICSASKSDYQNAYAWYRWMDANVQYDYYEGHWYTETQVINRGKGNCVDNSRTFRAGCHALGLKCNYIHGYSCYGDGLTANHQYNKVYIDNKTYVVDCGRTNASWGSHWGNCSGGESETTESW